MQQNQERPLPLARTLAEKVVELVEYGGYGFRLDVGANIQVLRAMVRWLPAFIRHGMMSAAFARAVAKRVPRTPIPVPRS
jgi:hypothetical protein